MNDSIYEMKFFGVIKIEEILGRHVLRSTCLYIHTGLMTVHTKRSLKNRPCTRLAGLGTYVHVQVHRQEHKQSTHPTKLS